MNSNTVDSSDAFKCLYLLRLKKWIHCVCPITWTNQQSNM